MEWVFLLRLEPNFSMCITDYKHNLKEAEKIADKLLSVIDSKPSYYIGIDSTTLSTPPFATSGRFLEKIKPLQVVYGEMFNAATLWHGIDVLCNPLKQRKVITVGPEYMKKLNLSADHISVPPRGCWILADQVESQAKKLIEPLLNEHPVIVYSCSLLAKWLIDVFYRKYGNKITQLDVGSCIDPWCGINSRPWHPQPNAQNVGLKKGDLIKVNISYLDMISPLTVPSTIQSLGCLREETAKIVDIGVSPSTEGSSIFLHILPLNNLNYLFRRGNGTRIYVFQNDLSNLFEVVTSKLDIPQLA